MALNARPRAHAASDAMIPVENPRIILSLLGNTDSDDDATATAPIPVSKKEKRKQKKIKHDSALPTPVDTDNETAPSTPRTPKSPKKNPTKTPQTATSSVPPPMPAAKNAVQTVYPLLICSLGNPGTAYVKTLHSAGHIMTSLLAERKVFSKYKKGLSGLVSKPDNTRMNFSFLGGFSRADGGAVTPEEDWTFWQSTSFMNVSGNGVKRAYTEWLKGVRAQSGSAATEGRLIVIHDELESALGKVTVRDGAASPKGHNGLKSCQQQLGGIKWWRVGVGIGRPESRDPNVVSKYVLGKMTATQMAAMDRCAINVHDALEEISLGKR